MPILRKGVAVAALTMAVTSLSLPASAATARPTAADFPCPPVLGICAYDVDDNLRVLFDDEADIVPPVVRAANYSADPWCFYNWFGYGGDRQELAPGEVADDFGFVVRAARRGPCD